jgi:hypothetical protein
MLKIVLDNLTALDIICFLTLGNASITGWSEKLLVKESV